MIKFNNLKFHSVANDPRYQTLIKRRFYNRGKSIEDFTKELAIFKFDDKNLVRPDFDHYFMRLCELAASRSNCMKKGNGCIITKDNRVVSTGYNGTPCGLKNCNEGGCKRCNSNVT